MEINKPISFVDHKIEESMKSLNNTSWDDLNGLQQLMVIMNEVNRWVQKGDKIVITATQKKHE